MAGWDMQIDPVSRDYVDDGAGGFVTTDTIATMCFHQLNVHENEWIAGPDVGNRAHELDPKSSETNARRYRNEYKRALQVFVDEGLAADLVIEVDRDSRTGRFAVRSSMRDVQRGDINLQGLLPLIPGG